MQYQKYGVLFKGKEIKTCVKCFMFTSKKEQRAKIKAEKRK